MSKIILLAFTLSLITGCAATKIADEYGSNTVTVIFACPGVNWTSKKLDETFCLMQSKYSPNEYILGEDTAEKYGDAALAALSDGLSLLFDGDIQEKWFAAAKRMVLMQTWANYCYPTGEKVIQMPSS